MIQGPCLNGHLEPRTSQPGRSARDQGPLLRFLGSEDPRARYEELYATYYLEEIGCQMHPSQIIKPQLYTSYLFAGGCTRPSVEQQTPQR